MDKAKLIFWRNFLGITFLVSFPVALLMVTITYVFWDTWVAVSKFTHVEETTLANDVFMIFVFLRIYFVFILLCPMLALHLMIKRSRSAAN